MTQPFTHGLVPAGFTRTLGMGCRTLGTWSWREEWPLSHPSSPSLPFVSMLGWPTDLRLGVTSGCSPDSPFSIGELGFWEKPLGFSEPPFGH